MKAAAASSPGSVINKTEMFKNQLNDYWVSRNKSAAEKEASPKTGEKNPPFKKNFGVSRGGQLMSVDSDLFY